MQCDCNQGGKRSRVQKNCSELNFEAVVRLLCHQFMLKLEQMGSYSIAAYSSNLLYAAHRQLGGGINAPPLCPCSPLLALTRGPSNPSKPIADNAQAPFTPMSINCNKSGFYQRTLVRAKIRKHLGVLESCLENIKKPMMLLMLLMLMMTRCLFLAGPV